MSKLAFHIAIYKHQWLKNADDEASYDHKMAKDLYYKNAHQNKKE